MRWPLVWRRDYEVLVLEAANYHRMLDKLIAQAAGVAGTHADHYQQLVAEYHELVERVLYVEERLNSRSNHFEMEAAAATRQEARIAKSVRNEGHT